MLVTGGTCAWGEYPKHVFLHAHYVPQVGLGQGSIWGGHGGSLNVPLKALPKLLIVGSNIFSGRPGQSENTPP